MNIERIKENLEAIYIDYYDGLYTDQQLKFILLSLYKNSNIQISKWSELILEAQWKNATEQDYKEKIKQLNQKNEEGDD